MFVKILLIFIMKINFEIYRLLTQGGAVPLHKLTINLKIDFNKIKSVS